MTMKDRMAAHYFPIADEHPYSAQDLLDDVYEYYRPFKCPRCGSIQTTRYTKLMVTSDQPISLSGDLVLRPIEVVTCMCCNNVTFHNFSTLRDA